MKHKIEVYDVTHIGHTDIPPFCLAKLKAESLWERGEIGYAILENFACSFPGNERYFLARMYVRRIEAQNFCHPSSPFAVHSTACHPPNLPNEEHLKNSLLFIPDYNRLAVPSYPSRASVGANSGAMDELLRIQVHSFK